MFLFYGVIVVIVTIIFYPVFRIKVVGRNNLPKDKGFVITPNHQTALDPVFVVIARLWGKPLIIMAKAELFKNKLLAFLFKRVGAEPIERGKGDTDAIESIVDKVRKGRGTLIFPEGTRSGKDEMGRFKSGAFVIAASANVGIVPCRIIYKGGKFKPFVKCTVVFGEPIGVEELNLAQDKSATNLRRCKQLLRERLEKLLLENKKYT